MAHLIAPGVWSDGTRSQTVPTPTGRERVVADGGMGFLPLLLAAVPAVASAVPSIVSLFKKDKGRDPSQAEIQALVAQLEAQRREAEEERKKLILFGGLGLLGVLLISVGLSRRRGSDAAPAPIMSPVVMASPVTSTAAAPSPAKNGRRRRRRS